MFSLVEIKDTLENPAERLDEREISTQTSKAEFSGVISKVTPNFILGILVTPETNEEDLRKTVRIVLEEIKRWSDENEEKRN